MCFKVGTLKHPRGTCPRVRADAQKRRKTLGPRSLESHECESNRFVRLS